MPIDFTCPNCQARLHAPDDYAGGSARCQQCGCAVKIPGLSTAAGPAEVASRPRVDTGLPQAPPPRDGTQAAGPPVAGISQPKVTSGHHSRWAAMQSTDRRVLLVVFCVVGVTLAGLWGFVMVRLSRQRAVNTTLEQLEKADRLVDEQREIEAVQTLLALRAKGVPADLEGEVDDRLGEHSELVEQLRAQEAATEQQKVRQEQDARQHETHRRTQELARKRRAKADKLLRVGGAFMGMLEGVLLVVAGCVLMGIGQLIRAFRDIAVNTYVIANTDEHGVRRTPAPYGQRAPRYRLIPVVAGVYDVFGAIIALAGAALIVFVLVNL